MASQAVADDLTIEQARRPTIPNTYTHHIFIVSDGSGETALNMMRAMLTQFAGSKGILTRRYARVNDKVKVDKIIKNAAQVEVPVLVAYTIVNSQLEVYFRNEIKALPGVRGIDLFAQPLNVLSGFLNARPDENPDTYHGVDDRYYKRMEAIEFTLHHDDGQRVSGLEEADIVLVGVSRTGKTPLSMYLSLYGYKVVNIPLAKGVKPPQELDEIDQKKIVGLIIDPHQLSEIRKKRIVGLHVMTPSEYSNPNAIIEEIEEVNAFFRRHRRWPVINVTNRSIEETASLVRDKVYGRDRKMYT